MGTELKRFADLTASEKLALSDEEIDRYIDLECAVSGVPLVPVAPGAKPKVEVKPDLVLYKFNEIYLRNQCDAVALAEFLTTVETVGIEYVPGPGYEHKETPLRAPHTYKPEPVFSEAAATNWHDAIGRQAQAEADWRKAKEAYDRILSQRAEVSEPIYDELIDLREDAAARANIRAEYARYVELAKGDGGIALAFLEKVYCLADYPGLREELVGTKQE